MPFAQVSRRAASRPYVALIGFLPVPGMFVVLVFAAAWLDTHSESVSVLNSTTAGIRICACVDEALDLAPGDVGEVLVRPGRQRGCDVFRDGRYLGCLVLDANRDAKRTVAVTSSVFATVPSRDCERIN